MGSIYAVAVSLDGDLVAAGGKTQGFSGKKEIYIFDRATGAIVHRIQGLPSEAIDLAFSPDGGSLAAALQSGGLRSFARDLNWAELARDEDYRDAVNGVAWAPDGRLVTASSDGDIRLYDSRLRRVGSITASLGLDPAAIAFNPSGSRLAVGFYDTAAIEIFAGSTLDALVSPTPIARREGNPRSGDFNLGSVSWSPDGKSIVAAGQIQGTIDGNRRSVLKRYNSRTYHRNDIYTGSTNTITSLLHTHDGKILVAGADPYLSLTDQKGSILWMHLPPSSDLRGEIDQSGELFVSSDGLIVDYKIGYKAATKHRFDLRILAQGNMTLEDNLTAPPEQRGMEDSDFKFDFGSWAFNKAGDRFARGVHGGVGMYDVKEGVELLWSRSTPETRL